MSTKIEYQKLTKSCLRFCDLLNECDKKEKEDFSHDLLLELLTALKEIIEIDVTSKDTSILPRKLHEDKVRKVIELKFNELDLYKHFFSPFDNDGFVESKLSNDLTEIFEAFTFFIENFTKDENEALWELKEDFDSHLSRHIFNSITVLYFISNPRLL